MLRLSHVIEALSGTWIDGLEVEITRTVIDSRQVVPGALFVALPGANVDGHAFVPDAFKRGALAALVDRKMALDLPTLDLTQKGERIGPDAVRTPLLIRVDDVLRGLQKLAAYWRRKHDLRVIGITGSVGKSTTKEVVAEVLSRRFPTVKSPGNLNNEIGLPLSILQLTEAHDHAVLEMGFYVPGEIALLCEIAQPQVGVVTNISQVHLERAGSMEAIVEGKGELVEALPPDPDGVAILNFDDPLVLGMASRTRARVITYGLSPEADIWANEVEGRGLEGIYFRLHCGGESMHLRVPMLGRHSVHTALRAAAVGFTEGLDWADVVGGLQDATSQLRLVAVRGPDGSLLLDDTYNAAPTSVLAALNLLEDLEGRRVAVLGDMLELGEYEEKGHRMVGARAARVVEELVTVGERAKWIADEAKHAGLSDEEVVVLENSQEALEYLEACIGEGDVVLVKGSRGMRMDLIVAGLEVADE
jgi:UDP-N-acetylmuramoyl-tripeptide--D-alanyl-D-alanine ligase